VVGALDTAGTALQGAIEQMDQRLNEAGDSLEARAKGLSGAAGQAAEDIAARARDLQEVVEDMVAKSNQSASQVDDSAARIADASERAFGSLHSARGTFKEASQELADAADKETTRILGAGVAVRQESQALGSALERTGDRLNETLADLKRQSGELKTTNKNVLGDLATAAELLRATGRGAATDVRAQRAELDTMAERFEAYAKRLEEATGRTMEMAQEIGQSFEKQAEAFTRGREQARIELQAAERETAASRRRLFLNDLTFITERLNSLSVDITRAVDRNVPKDAWARYLDGDRAVFARSLLRRRRDKFSLQAIKHHYEDDAEFREHINQYLRQFQEALEQAEEHDPEDVLAATLLSSDVGKLYLLISRALDRIK
jgi:methyl-accepting chemotaxis protein